MTTITLIVLQEDKGKQYHPVRKCSFDIHRMLCTNASCDIQGMLLCADASCDTQTVYGCIATIAK
jgi:hypothetical protein